MDSVDVSIVITAYNYSHYIEECIKSCIDQKNTKLQFEVIVVDDGSTDNSSAILETINYHNLRKFKIQNSGIEAASNFGFEKAQGKFIVRVDADDKLSDNYLSVMEKNINDEYAFFYSDYYQIDAESVVITNIHLPEFEKEEILDRGDFLATGTLFSKKALAEIGFYSTEIKNSGLENFELIIKMLIKGSKGKHVSGYLFSYRRHSLNLSEVKRDYIINNGINMFTRMNLGKFRTNKYHPYGLVV